MFEENEANDRLLAIIRMTKFHLSTNDILYSTKKVLEQIINIADGTEIPSEEKIAVMPKIIISCDASCKVNPGGPASVGVVIQFPKEKYKNKREDLETGYISKATTNNQAEYEAIYHGLITCFHLTNNPGYPVEVHSDSKIVVYQLLGKMKCNDPNLQERRQGILDLVKQLPVQVSFIWAPRNSTDALRRANNYAQMALGVKIH